MDKRGHFSLRSLQSESAWRTKPATFLKQVSNFSIFLVASAHSMHLIFHFTGFSILWELELAPEPGGRREGVGREQAFWTGLTDSSPHMPAMGHMPAIPAGALILSI